MTHEKARWHGSNPQSPEVTVCAHMVGKLDEWASGIGNDILLKALKGCGSYQTDTEASADTHRLGGAIDIDNRNLTDDERRRVETVGRRVGLLVWKRHPDEGDWTFHAHALDPACSRLSSQARSQFIAFGDGRNGLANGRRDQGDRTHKDEIMEQFERVRAGFGPNPNFLFPYGPSFLVPGEPGSMYGRANAGTNTYSGTVHLDPTRFKNTGTRASGFLTIEWIRGHIKRIQRMVGEDPNGEYMGRVESKVKEFQRRFGLTDDGKVGPVTWKKMAEERLQLHL